MILASVPSESDFCKLNMHYSLRLGGLSTIEIEPAQPQAGDSPADMCTVHSTPIRVCRRRGGGIPVPERQRAAAASAARAPAPSPPAPPSLSAERHCPQARRPRSTRTTVRTALQSGNRE